MHAPSRPGSPWRYALLSLLTVGSFVLLLGLEPIPQDLAYHNFADTRAFFGIPNALDVLSNLPFLAVGALGLRFCLRQDVGAMRASWVVFFAGVALVSAGSAYYHWRPDNASLVWDRLPMTVGFMGIFIALVGECVHARFAQRLLVPAIVLGAASVAYWHWTDDLRPYAWVQFMPLLVLPVVLGLFGSPYTHQRMLGVALACYVLAKFTEFFDGGVLSVTQGLVSGHTLKHLLAAACCYSVLLMLKERRARA